MSQYLLPAPKLLPKPSLHAYIAEYSRLPWKIHAYAANHLWQTVILFLLWYSGVSYLTVPKLYRQFIATSTETIDQAQRSIANIYNDQPTQPVRLIVPTDIPSPTATPIPRSLVPYELRIPKLNIVTEIEHVGQTKTFEMDVPKNAAHAAWYVYGAKPGEEGNAVLGGHYDTPSGKPAVFYKLQTLIEGDEITIMSEDGFETTFVVTGKERHSYKNFPEEYVFHTKPGTNLNLITCGGIWDVKEKIYNERVVVYAQKKTL